MEEVFARRPRSHTGDPGLGRTAAEREEGATPELFLETWIKSQLLNVKLLQFFVVEQDDSSLTPLSLPGGAHRTIIAKLLNYRDRDTILQEVQRKGDPTYENKVI
ncbi:hypothetical protein NDU88_004314 [Pleurodeles waltl]|uniref:Uncharacterized protein n=1 Tax=Pleurodeles waltl TaxID=8319 RepID=A0AAV7NMC0_PLEWA|nr:hypothetical protein NDU88_004314 [Pleurodeles waltl]